MSFSNNIKNELARLEVPSHCCQIAQLAGLVRMDGTILIGSHRRIQLELVTENAAVARMAFKSLKKLFQVETEITVSRRNRLKKNNIYIVRLPNQEKINEVLNVLGLTKNGLMYNPGINERLVRKECCQRSYLRGVFLGAGSLSDPENSYHLELVTNSEEYSEALVELMSRFGLSPHISSRKNNLVVYLKDSEQIVDYLNIIGAHHALLDLENIRIQKDMRNQVNRLVNCETANLHKTVDAAYHQKMCIRDRLRVVLHSALVGDVKGIGEADRFAGGVHAVHTLTVSYTHLRKDRLFHPLARLAAPLD